MAAANDENGFAVPALRCGRPVSGLLMVAALFHARPTERIHIDRPPASSSQ
jgi:hypothetical protein